MKNKIFSFGLFLLLLPAFVVFSKSNSYAQWFQTFSGNVHAEGDIASNVPTTDYFSKIFAVGGKSGLVSYTGSLGGNIDSETNPSWVFNTPSFASVFSGKYNYAYFDNKLNSSPNYQGNLTGNINNCLPGSDLPDTPGIYIYTKPGILRIHCNDTPVLNILSGVKVIILVDQNTRIESYIKVASGGFFAVISQGSIEFANNITTSNDPNNPDIEGVYIADEQITFENINQPIYVKGIFIGWGSSGTSFALNRNMLPDVLGEVFIYDPRILIAAPSELYEEESAIWKEVFP